MLSTQDDISLENVTEFDEHLIADENPAAVEPYEDTELLISLFIFLKRLFLNGSFCGQ